MSETNTGRCHCGNIETAYAHHHGNEIPVRACSCGYCVKHGGVWTSDPNGSLKVRVADSGALTRYQFGTRTADFYVCGRCGVVPVVVSTIEQRACAVVNVNTFEGVDAGRLNRTVTDFDGEGTGERLQRRQRNWIPVVEFLAPGRRSPGVTSR